MDTERKYQKLLALVEQMRKQQIQYDELIWQKPDKFILKNLNHTESESEVDSFLKENARDCMLARTMETLRNMGMKNARWDGTYPITILRDKRWHSPILKAGYETADLIYPDGGVTSFLLLFPDGMMATAENFMCPNVFLSVAEELELEFQDIMHDDLKTNIIKDDDDEECYVQFLTIEDLQIIHKNIQTAKQQ